MATLQICYLRNGQVVCASTPVSSAAAKPQAAPDDSMTTEKPPKEKVKKDVDDLLESALADSPEFFVMSYNPK